MIIHKSFLLAFEDSDDELPKEAEKQLHIMVSQRYKPEKSRQNLNLLLNDSYKIRRSNLEDVAQENRVSYMLEHYPWFRVDPILVTTGIINCLLIVKCSSCVIHS